MLRDTEDDVGELAHGPRPETWDAEFVREVERADFRLSGESAEASIGGADLDRDVVASAE